VQRSGRESAPSSSLLIHLSSSLVTRFSTRKREPKKEGKKKRRKISTSFAHTFFFLKKKVFQVFFSLLASPSLRYVSRARAFLQFTT
jgi:hypothetical protein